MRDAASTWDAQAARYGRQEHREARAIAAALRLADPRPDDRLLDVATGTGLLLRMLAREPGRPRTAVGVDRSRRMLERVGALPPGWGVVAGDARELPRADASVDLATCCYLLHLLSPADRAAVLGELRRVLRPGGGSRLVVVTVWADPRTIGGRARRALLRAAARARPAAWGGLLPVDPSADVEHAGFTITRRVTLPGGGHPSLVLLATPGRPG